MNRVIIARTVLLIVSMITLVRLSSIFYEWGFGRVLIFFILITTYLIMVGVLNTYLPFPKKKIKL